MVTLIVVDYMTIPKTYEYIKSFFANIEATSGLAVVVVDNAEDSTMGLEHLEEKNEGKAEQIYNKDIPYKVYQFLIDNKKLLYVCAEKNLGYAKGNNLGARVSDTYLKNSFYIFSNNDLYFTEKLSISKLIEPLITYENIAVVGPAMVDKTGILQNPKKFQTIWQSLFLYYYLLLLPKAFKRKIKDSEVESMNSDSICDWVVGSFLVVDARKFWEVFGFDEQTFLFGEEIILAERLSLKGYVMYYKNIGPLIHAHGETVKSSFSEMRGIYISFSSLLYYFSEYKNMGILLRILAIINFGFFSVLFMIKKWVGRRVNTNYEK